jgi:hypothetical protein
MGAVETGAMVAGSGAARGALVVVGGVSRRAVGADGAGVGAGRVGTTVGVVVRGVGAGVGAGVGGPRRSPGASGGRPLSDGPCTPDVRPSSAGGRRNVEVGAGVGEGAGVGCSVCAAAGGSPPATSEAASAASDKRAALSPRPSFRTVIFRIRNPVLAIPLRL